ncbi:MAG: C39 family peptidase [Peptococcaceae bacterium]|nr:C39 family peptidase [Peptococcaceae bacterium]
MKKFLKIVSAFLAAAIFIAAALFWALLGVSPPELLAQRLPLKDRIAAQYRESVLLSDKSYFEKQEKNQCAGFSSAYLLRFLGEDIDGTQGYQEMKYTFRNGYVLPQSIQQMVKKYGYDGRFYRGTVETLKMRLSANTPVIALIGQGYHWQHYVTVVGYDENAVFIYDSNYDADNSSGYNRKMTIQEFSAVWHNGIPFFNTVYFAIE